MLFWLFCLVVLVIELVAIIIGAPGWGLAALIACGLILQKYFDVPVTDYLPKSITLWIVFVILYVVLGAGWSIFKFRMEYKEAMQHIVSRHMGLIRDWKRENPEITETQLKEKWNEYVEEYSPKVYDFKGDIFGWVVAWPLSVLNYILVDLLYNVWDTIYSWISEIYERIAKSLRDSIKD
jgi:hypothetical protein